MPFQRLLLNIMCMHAIVIFTIDALHDSTMIVAACFGDHTKKRIIIMFGQLSPLPSLFLLLLLLLLFLLCHLLAGLGTRRHGHLLLLPGRGCGGRENQIESKATHRHICKTSHIGGCKNIKGRVQLQIQDLHYSRERESKEEYSCKHKTSLIVNSV